MSDEILSNKAINALGEILETLQPLTLNEQFILANLIKGGMDAAYSLEYIQDAQQKNILKDFDPNTEKH